MKRTGFYCAGIVLMLVSALTMLSCEGLFGGESGNGNNTGLAAIKITSQQVYEESYVQETLNFKTTPLGGDVNFAVTGNGFGGSVRAGKLSYEIGIPGRLVPFNPNLIGDMPEAITDVKISPADVQAAFLSLSTHDNGQLSKVSHAQHVDQQTGLYSYSNASVQYVYVNKDLNFTATGETRIVDINEDEKVTTIVQDISMNLKKGWNIVTVMNIGAGTAVEGTGTISVTVGDNSACKWIFYEIDSPALGDY